MCPWCTGKGIVFAAERVTWDLFIFGCRCDPQDKAPWLRNRKYPAWRTQLEKSFIPEYLAKAPTLYEVHQVFQKKEQSSSRFQGWLKYFGREKFVELFKSWKELKTDDTGTSDEASDLSMGRTPRGVDSHPRLQGSLAPGEEVLHL